MFVNGFLDQDFVNRHNLFVVGKRLNEERQVWEYYVKSRKAEDYRQMVLDTLYHPPSIDVVLRKEDGILRLVHHFEGKPLVRDFIAETLMGVEFLWGGAVQLETDEVEAVGPPPAGNRRDEPRERDILWRRVLYTMHNRQLSRQPM
jgi:stage V sporulation protein R